jgi:hypothetical protein
VVATDLDGDGKVDLIGPLGGSQSLGVALGNGDGTFRAQPSAPLPSPPSSRAAVGDVNGDGIPDVLVASSAGTAMVLVGDGAGGFGAALELPAAPHATRAALVDLDGDHKPDLCLGGNGVATYVVRNTSH